MVVVRYGGGIPITSFPVGRLNDVARRRFHPLRQRFAALGLRLCRLGSPITIPDDQLALTPHATAIYQRVDRGVERRSGESVPRRLGLGAAPRLDGPEPSRGDGFQ